MSKDKKKGFFSWFGFQKKKSSKSVTIKKEKKSTYTSIKKKSFFSNLREGLKKTRNMLLNGFKNIFGENKIDKKFFYKLEEHLLSIDIGVKESERIINKLKKIVESKKKKISENDILDLLKKQILKILKKVEKPILIKKKTPFVILLVGVNGSGKTTVIGKLANLYKKKNSSVFLAAGDTFRAAAIEQLKIWGERSKVPVISHFLGADSASVIFDAFQSAKAKKIDVLLADTAGRLQNNVNLMEELKKIVRVIKKIDKSAPHEIILTLDANTGQNNINQISSFYKKLNITGIILTKLDGTAKAGSIITIAEKFLLPVYYVGVGERIDDLLPFDSKNFVDSLFCIERKK